jgi:hypothetical protein
LELLGQKLGFDVTRSVMSTAPRLSPAVDATTKAYKKDYQIAKSEYERAEKAHCNVSEQLEQLLSQVVDAENRQQQWLVTKMECEIRLKEAGVRWAACTKRAPMTLTVTQSTWSVNISLILMTKSSNSHYLKLRRGPSKPWMRPRKSELMSSDSLKLAVGQRVHSSNRIVNMLCKKLAELSERQSVRDDVLPLLFFKPWIARSWQHACVETRVGDTCCPAPKELSILQAIVATWNLAGRRYANEKRLDLVFLQEHHAEGQAFRSLVKQFHRDGCKVAATPACVAKKKAQLEESWSQRDRAWASIRWAHDFGIAPRNRSRWVSGKLCVEGVCVLRISVYLCAGLNDSPTNLGVLKGIGILLSHFGLPFVVTGGWQMTPAQLGATGWLSQIRQYAAHARGRSNLCWRKLHRLPVGALLAVSSRTAQVDFERLTVDATQLILGVSIRSASVLSFARNCATCVL